MKWNPHKYQLDAVKFMVQRACAGLFLDPGLGKTSISFAAFKILKAKGLVERANRFLETSFLPGRRFDSPDGFNEQLAGWLERVKPGDSRFGSVASPLDRMVTDDPPWAG